MISPGALVTVDTALFVVCAAAPGGRWYLSGKRDGQTFAHTAEPRDIVVIRETRTYARGETVEYAGVPRVVTFDLGDDVELIIPGVPPGERTIVAKAALLLEAMK